MAHARTPTHVHIAETGNSDSQKQPLLVSQALFFRLSPAPDRQIGKHGVISSKTQSLPFIFPGCNSTREGLGGRFIRREIETESKNAILCGRQNETLPTFPFSPHRDSKSVGAVGGREGRKQKRKNRYIETIVRHSEVPRRSGQICQADV